MNLAYYPTLFYNVMRNRLSNVDWPWYSRIDDTVILGALPFKSMVDQLIKDEQVGGVVCVTQAFEVDNSWAANKADWEAKGVKYHWLPIHDFVYSTDTDNVKQAVEFIKNFQNSGKTVYVHCKAGRTRSAMVVGCYLMDVHGWYTPAAIAQIRFRRPQIILRQAHWTTLEDYCKQFVWGPKAEQTKTQETSF